MKEASSMGKAKPTADQAKVEKLFPAIARYVRGYGYIEIGDQESFGFVVRAIGYGGLDYEDDTTETLSDVLGRPIDGLVPNSVSSRSLVVLHCFEGTLYAQEERAAQRMPARVTTKM